MIRILSNSEVLSTALFMNCALQVNLPAYSQARPLGGAVNMILIHKVKRGRKGFIQSSNSNLIIFLGGKKEYFTS